MGKKYIIELEEPEMLDEQKFYQCTQMPWWAMSENVVENLTPYTEPDLEQVRRDYDAWYEKGLADAWEAAKKIAVMDTETSENVTGYFGLFRIMKNLTPMQAIEKIRQYEKEKEEIKVGDEVATDAGNRASVLYENPDGTQVFVFKSDGTAAWWTKSALHRTGRNFPEIAAVLEKMRGEQDGKRREE